jgi:type IV secretory pathway VirB2 component (pilin)
MSFRVYFSTCGAPRSSFRHAVACWYADVERLHFESNDICLHANQLEIQMAHRSFAIHFRRATHLINPNSGRRVILLVLCFAPVLAQAQGSPFDSGFNALQTLFTGTIAKVASLIAIVIGGYSFAHGEPGAKKALAGVAAGTGIAVLAVNVLSWLWGV